MTIASIARTTNRYMGAMRNSLPIYSVLQAGRAFARNSFPQNRKPVIMKKTETPSGPSSA